MQAALTREKPELAVLRVGDRGAPPRGTPDPALLRWCEREGFVLVSNDRRTLPGHLAAHLAAGRHCPGIVWMKSGASYESVIENLILIAEVARADDLRDQITVVPL